jgi:PAS domain S-box-containing protein
MLQSSASTLKSPGFNQTTLNQSANPIFVVDEVGQITFANERAEKLFGFRSAELIGQPLDRAINSQYQGTCLAEAAGRAARRMLRAGHAAAERGLRSSRAVELEGQRLGEVLVIHDLTERTWAEEACRETQLRLRALLDSAMDGIITLDAESRIMMCNAAIENIFGHTAGELVGRSIDCILPDGLPVKADPPAEAWVRQIGRLGRLRGVRASGEAFPIEASISEVEVRNQKFLTLTLRDISERMRVEEAFAESQERLRQSQKMAVVGHLTGGVVHDFNNLLTIIGGHTELLLAGLPADAPMRDSLSQIRSASLRAASLTRQLLAFSRKQVVEPKNLD